MLCDWHSISRITVLVLVLSLLGGISSRAQDTGNKQTEMPVIPLGDSLYREDCSKTDARGNHIVDKETLLAWLKQQYGIKMSPEELRSALISARALPPTLQDQQALVVAAGYSVFGAGRATEPEKAQPFVGSDPANFEVSTYFAADSPLEIICKKAPAAPEGPQWLNNIVVRGAPDTLGTDYDASHADNWPVSRNSPRFSSASSGTVSFSSTGTTDTNTGVVQLALGYTFPVNNNYTIIPFGYMNRNFTEQKGTTKFTQNMVQLGIPNSIFSILPQPFSPSGTLMGNLLSITPEYIWDYKYGTRFGYLHLVDAPIVLGYINDYWVSNRYVAIAPIIDLRADGGVYSNRGSLAASNPNFIQIGSRFGGLLSVKTIGNNWADISATETYLGGFEENRKNISYMQVSGTYYLKPKTIGIQVSYRNGNLETTAKRDQGWLISLAVKY